MGKYEKPVVLGSDELAEGVYLASGSDCYTVTTNIHQTPQEGRGDFRIQVDAVHAADHHGTAQVLVITFNQPVIYKSSNGTLESGDGTGTLRISYSYHNNATDTVGLGDVVVEANVGLAVTSAVLECNRTCAQH